ncbi:MAG: thiol reductant ABC exporter subunit CydD, partial [Caulobacteraceae bacterium]
AGRGARAATKIKTAVRARLLRASLDARPGERPPVGETMTQVVEGVEALDGYYARFVPARAAGGLAPLLVVVAMGFASPVAALIELVTFVPFVIAMALAGGAAAAESRRQFEALTRLSGLFADRVRALPVVLAFNAEAGTTGALGQAAQTLADRTLRVLRVAFISSAALEFFAALSVALVAVYCGFDLLGLLPFPTPERLDLGRAVFALALAPEAYQPMRRLAAVYHDRQAAEAAVDGLIGMEGTPRRVSPRPPAPPAAPAIRFEGVRVVYAGDVRPALDGFNLSLGPGDVVALMGPTGAGKSTVLNLLLGLAQPTEGEITVDGVRLAEIGSVSAAWAGQAPVVTPGTLAQNIALGRREASPDAIAQAAELTGLAGIQGGLTRWLDERGGGLSGGERRRLALARAILRDAPVLLLDEPTANLDARSEAELLSVIARAAYGRTTLIATHSDAVAALAHRVVRLAA